VKRDELRELHYITPTKNVSSIIERGILSHRRAQVVDHVSVAMAEIQDRRRLKRFKGGRPLHEYANLYICARNPMLFKRKDHHADLCVLRVDVTVIDISDVIITDQNAVSH
jgi:ssDNA thymidine ADP-ribosyltransferase, DarT